MYILKKRGERDAQTKNVKKIITRGKSDQTQNPKIIHPKSHRVLVGLLQMGMTICGGGEPGAEPGKVRREEGPPHATQGGCLHREQVGRPISGMSWTFNTIKSSNG